MDKPMNGTDLEQVNMSQNGVKFMQLSQELRESQQELTWQKQEAAELRSRLERLNATLQVREMELNEAFEEMDLLKEKFIESLQEQVRLIKEYSPRAESRHNARPKLEPELSSNCKIFSVARRKLRFRSEDRDTETRPLSRDYQSWEPPDRGRPSVRTPCSPQRERPSSSSPMRTPERERPSDPRRLSPELERRSPDSRCRSHSPRGEYWSLRSRNGLEHHRRSPEHYQCYQENQYGTRRLPDARRPQPSNSNYVRADRYLDDRREPGPDMGYDCHNQPPTETAKLGPSLNDFNKIAEHMNRFNPKPGGDNDTSAYLRDLNMYFRRLPHVTVEDQIFLIKLTSSREVSSFIERQPAPVRGDYGLLCTALRDEYPDSVQPVGLASALAVKQGQNEHPRAYHHRLRRAFFGSQNDVGMEEDKNFKELFIQNLHNDTSLHMGVSVCPLTQSCSELKALADRAFVIKQKATSKPQNVTDILAVNLHPQPVGAPTKKAQISSGKQRKPPFRQLLGNILTKGTARKHYLPVTLENELTHDALLDTGADISLISTDLFRSLQETARRSHRDLKSQPCFLEVQPYSYGLTALSEIAQIQFTVGPMTVRHHVYVSPLNNIPLLIGLDLLNRFKPLIDFHDLKIWAQVRRPLPTRTPEPQEPRGAQYTVIGTKPAGETAPNPPTWEPLPTQPTLSVRPRTQTAAPLNACTGAQASVGPGDIAPRPVRAKRRPRQGRLNDVSGKPTSPTLGESQSHRGVKPELGHNLAVARHRAKSPNRRLSGRFIQSTRRPPKLERRPKRDPRPVHAAAATTGVDTRDTTAIEPGGRNGTITK